MSQETTRHGQGMGPEKRDVTDSEYSHVLSSETRRKVLSRLAEANQPMHLADIATDLGGGRELYIQLHHNHAPLLDDIGIADYNPKTKAITLNTTEDLPVDLKTDSLCERVTSQS